MKRIGVFVPNSIICWDSGESMAEERRAGYTTDKLLITAIFDISIHGSGGNWNLVQMSPTTFNKT